MKLRYLCLTTCRALTRRAQDGAEDAVVVTAVLLTIVPLLVYGMLALGPLEPPTSHIPQVAPMLPSAGVGQHPKYLAVRDGIYGSQPIGCTNSGTWLTQWLPAGWQQPDHTTSWCLTGRSLVITGWPMTTIQVVTNPAITTWISPLTRL